MIGKESLTFGNDGTIQLKPAIGHLSTCPAIFRVFRRRSNLHQFEEIKPLPALFRLFSSDHANHLEFDAVDLPMVVPPVPWTSVKSGGYLLRTSKLVRAIGDGKLDAPQDERMLRPILDALNQLGSTPWRINQPLLDVVNEVFVNQQRHEDKLSALSIPRHQELLRPPQISHALKHKLESGQLDMEDIKQYNRFRSEETAFNQFRTESYSLWCDALYRISIANHYRSAFLYYFLF